MTDTTPEHELLRFGPFELRPESGELFRQGEPVRLQQQPARLLELLVRRPGEVVSREEIRSALWGEETYVDSDQGINYCVRQVRLALDDDAGSPRFVETVPKRGYRFVAPVERGAAGPESSPAGPSPRTSPGAGRRRWRRPAVAAAVFLVVAAAGVLAFLAGGGAESSGVEGPVPQTRTVVVPEAANDRYLRARHLLDTGSAGADVEAARQAVELLRAALAEAPDFAAARAALANAWLYRYDLPRPEALERAGEAARKALELDPGLAETHTVAAAVRLFLHLEWGRAGEHLDRALELDPDHVDAVFLRAVMLSARGRHEEAIATARRAMQLQPRHLPNVSLGWFYFFAGRHEEAIDEAERVLEIHPLDQPSHEVLMLAALELEDAERANREFFRYYLLIGGTPVEELDRMVDLAVADPESVRVRELWRGWWEHFDDERDLVGQGLNPTLPAQWAVYTGHEEGAAHYLLWACEERAGSWDLPFVAVDPRWEPLRGDPTFAEVVQCVGPEGGLLPDDGLRGLLD